MNTHLYTVLLLAMIWIFSGVHPVMSEESKQQELKDRFVKLQARFDEIKPAFEMALKQPFEQTIKQPENMKIIVEILDLSNEMSTLCFLLNQELDKQYYLPNEALDYHNYLSDAGVIWKRFDHKGNQCYGHLHAHGDYTQLKLIVRSRKPDYNLGERVWLKFFVRNDSDSEVRIYGGPSTLPCAPLWKLFYSNYDEVTKTPKWEEEFQKYKQGKYGTGMPGPSWSFSSGADFYIKLQPGQEYELDWVHLNDYFDLTKPDTYELTCFVTTFIEGQKFQPPLQSNTLTFRVLEEPVAEDYWATGIGSDGAKLIYQRERESQDAPYTNPPPGEEVFKQPKPPKNVFYVQSSTGPREIIDVSPYMYYHERAKEQEAQAAKPPDAAKPPAE